MIKWFIIFFKIILLSNSQANTLTIKSPWSNKYIFLKFPLVFPCNYQNRLVILKLKKSMLTPFFLLFKNNGGKQDETSTVKIIIFLTRHMALVILPSIKLTMSMNKGFKSQESKYLKIMAISQPY